VHVDQNPQKLLINSCPMPSLSSQGAAWGKGWRKELWRNMSHWLLLIFLHCLQDALHPWCSTHPGMPDMNGQATPRTGMQT
jgi:hypothetical protein